MFGKLDRVPDQIHKHLSQPVAIAYDLIGYLGVELQYEFKALLVGPQRESSHGLFYEFAQVERFSIEAHFAGVDFGEIQYIINNRHERLGRLHGALDVLSLDEIELSTQGQLGHPDHAIHGSTNLVAHISYKLTLQPAGFLGLVNQSEQFTARGVHSRYHLVEGRAQVIYFIPGSQGSALG